jgi:hypothetical protein
MRYVPFDPWNLDADGLSDAEKAEFRSWLDGARAAAKKAVEEYEQNGEPSEETQEIWRNHKKWLLRNKFNNKCAYCEKSLSDIPTDAEHWRPKRRITGVKTGEHPGYFWLAYSWRNLLPACSMCNSYDGKKNQFPITNVHVFRRRLTDAERAQLIRPDEAIESTKEPGVWYLGAEDLDALEDPLLLHPYVERDPTEHLEFTSDGAVEGRTKKGEWSIRVFALNRDELRELRYRAEQDTVTGLSFFINWALNNGRSRQESLEEAEVTVARNLDERSPFSAAKLAALARAVESRRPPQRAPQRGK